MLYLIVMAAIAATQPHISDEILYDLIRKHRRQYYDNCRDNSNYHPTYGIIDAYKAAILEYWSILGVVTDELRNKRLSVWETAIKRDYSTQSSYRFNNANIVYDMEKYQQGSNLGSRYYAHLVIANGLRTNILTAATKSREADDTHVTYMIALDCNISSTKIIPARGTPAHNIRDNLFSISAKVKYMIAHTECVISGGYYLRTIFDMMKYGFMITKHTPVNYYLVKFHDNCCIGCVGADGRAVGIPKLNPYQRPSSNVCYHCMYGAEDGPHDFAASSYNRSYFHAAPLTYVDRVHSMCRANYMCIELYNMRYNWYTTLLLSDIETKYPIRSPSALFHAFIADNSRTSQCKSIISESIHNLLAARLLRELLACDPTCYLTQLPNELLAVLFRMSDGRWSPALIPLK
jgi:hypothetical protein